MFKTDVQNSKQSNKTKHGLGSFLQTFLSTTMCTALRYSSFNDFSFSYFVHPFFKFILF